MATTAKGTPYVESADLVSGWPAVSSSLADHIDDKKLDTYPAQNSQTGTSYTFVLADAEKIVTASNGSASTYEVPPQASVAWLTGTILRVVNLGAGVVTFQGGSGVTVNNTAATLSQYESANLIRTGSNTWQVAKNGSTPGMALVTSQTFSAASAVNVNNCFTSTYENYRIVVSVATSTNAQPQLRLRASGSDAAGASDYGNQNIKSVGGSVSGRSANESSMLLNTEVATGTDYVVIDVFGPQLASPTALLAVNRGIKPLIETVGTLHGLSTAYDGFSLFGSAGTITGTVRVYGYKN